MTRPPGSLDDALARHVDSPRLLRLGLRAWLLIGVGLVAAVSALLLYQVPGLVVPLVVAAVMSALLVPVVDRLEALRVPRPLGAVVVLAGLAAAIAGSLWLMIDGVIDQGPEISRRIEAGIREVAAWLSERGIGPGAADGVTSDIAELLKNALGGVFTSITGAFSSAASFVVGVGVGAFLFYYLLRDWERLTQWVGRNLGAGASGPGVIEDAVSSIRQYFGSLTVTAVGTAVLIGIAAVVLDVPLAFTIAVVTLVTSYIPYLGAIFSGAFATLVALGAQGTQTAVIFLVVILLVQNVFQTVLLTKLTSDALRIHPIVNLGSTIVGAVAAGVLGATLSAPVVAMTIRIKRRLSSRPADAAEA